MKIWLKENWFVNTKGFIQIPILIAIIIGVIVISGASYFGIRQYQNKQQANILKSAVQKETEEVIKQDNQTTSTVEISEVEKLRQEVDQLKKQQSKAEQSIKSADSNNRTAPTQNTQKLTSQITTAQDENFSSIAASALLSQAKSYQDLVDFAEGAIQYIDTSLDELATLIAKHEGYVFVLGAKNSEISQSYIDLYKEDMSLSNVYKAQLVSHRDTAKKNVSVYKNAALEKTSKFVDRQEFISIIETLKNDTNWNLSKDYLFKTYENYNTYRKDRDNFYVKTDAELRALYTLLKKEPASAPTYQPQIAPTFQMPQLPKTTSCTLSGDGGVGLQAYINCITY